VTRRRARRNLRLAIAVGARRDGEGGRRRTEGGGGGWGGSIEEDGEWCRGL